MTRSAGSLLLCLVVATGLYAGQSAGSSASSPVGADLDLRGYLAELDKWSLAAQKLEDHPEEAAGLQEALPHNWPVTISGQRFLVPTDWLRKKLESIQSDPTRATGDSKDIRIQLETMRASVQWLTQPSPIAPSSARQALDEILNQREFSGVRGASPLQTWWDRAWGWMTSRLAAAFGRIGPHPRLSASIVWALAIGLALFLVAWLARSVLRAPGRRPIDLGGPVIAERWRKWAAQALDCAKAGDYRGAIHLAYWAGIYRLEGTGLWQVDHARTPREYLKLVPGDHARRPMIHALTRRFERTWYGGEPASADDFRSALADLEGLGCLLHWKPAIPSS